MDTCHIIDTCYIADDTLERRFRSGPESMRFERPSVNRTPYTAPQTAYDLRKLRRKNLLGKIGNSRRYQPTAKGLRAMAALPVLRHKVIQPLLAASCNPSLHPEPQDPAHIDEHYASLRSGMRGLFEALGTAA